MNLKKGGLGFTVCQTLKRYAESDKEWRILLERQNKIITDLLGIDSKAILVTGESKLDENAAFITEEETVFKKYNFVRLDKIDLYKLIPKITTKEKYLDPHLLKLFVSKPTQ